MQHVRTDDNVVGSLDEILRLRRLVHVESLEHHSVLKVLENLLRIREKATRNVGIGVARESGAQVLKNSLRRTASSSTYIAIRILQIAAVRMWHTNLEEIHARIPMCYLANNRRDEVVDLVQTKALLINSVQHRILRHVLEDVGPGSNCIREVITDRLQETHRNVAIVSGELLVSMYQVCTSST
jgi:hypothetical protein